VLDKRLAFLVFASRHVTGRTRYSRTCLALPREFILP
jgi:hypothetical protein